MTDLEGFWSCWFECGCEFAWAMWVIGVALEHVSATQSSEIILSRTVAPGLFFWVFFANGRIWVPADIDSANCRIICSAQNVVKTFPKVFHWIFVENLSPSFFPRAMEQRAPWKSNRWNRVQHYGRIERGDGSISFIRSPQWDWLGQFAPWVQHCGASVSD